MLTYLTINQGMHNKLWTQKITKYNISKFIGGRATNWFTKYETAHLVATWNQVQYACIT
jgi:hypothetical protein